MNINTKGRAAAGAIRNGLGNDLKRCHNRQAVFFHYKRKKILNQFKNIELIDPSSREKREAQK